MLIELFSLGVTAEALRAIIGSIWNILSTAGVELPIVKLLFRLVKRLHSRMFHDCGRSHSPSLSRIDHGDEIRRKRLQIADLTDILKVRSQQLFVMHLLIVR